MRILQILNVLLKNLPREESSKKSGKYSLYWYTCQTEPNADHLTLEY